MPLSDHEQRLLQQMEQALYDEDPKFAEGLRKPRAAKMDRTRFIMGIGGVVLGLAILVAGAATSWAVIGILGFLAMIAGAFVAYRAWNGNIDQEAAAAAADAQSASAPKSSPSSEDEGFMNKMEERWRKRREQGGDTL